MKIKSCPVSIKAAGTNEGTDEGEFEAIVAAYNLDSVGDKILPGAFADTLADWKTSGDPIPVLWSHMSFDPDYHIGVVEQAEERDDGLWVKGRIDVDSPKAAQVFKLLKGRRVTQFSFAYDIEDAAMVEQEDTDPYFELRKLKLYEVGPTLIGANQETELLSAKSAHMDMVRVAVREVLAEKAGRTLSAKNEERVRDIARLAKDLLESLDTSTSTDDGDDEKATPTSPATSEEPEGAKEDEPVKSGTASLRQRIDLALFEAEVDSLTTNGGVSP